MGPVRRRWDLLRLRWILCFGGCLLAIAAAPVLAAEASAERASGAMLDCAKETLVDYGGPVARLRRHARIVPRDGRVPFGPKTLRLARAGRIVENGPARLGFWLRNARRGNDARQTDMFAITRVRRVGVQRRTGRPIGRRRQAISSVVTGKRQRLFLGGRRVGGRSAIYRVELEIRRGKRLARYVEFVRVVARRVRFRLAMSADRYEGGQRMLWRVENPGTTDASFGAEYMIERLGPAGWEESGLGASGFPSVGFVIGPGVAGECEGFSLPVDAGTGEYRLTKLVRAGVFGQPRKIQARFTIDS